MPPSLGAFSIEVFMIKWRKKDGTEIETNEREETIAMAKELGWKRAKKEKEPEKTQVEPAKIELPTEQQEELL